MNAPILARPVGPLASASPRRVLDISLGGLRAYTDEERRPGTRLELELLLPEGSVTILAEVVWVEGLPDGSPARYDVGLRFLDPVPEDLDRILKVLDRD